MEGRIRERKLLAETVVREIRNQVRAGKQPDRSELQTMSELVAVYLPQFVEKLRQLYPSISDDNILFLHIDSTALHSKGNRSCSRHQSASRIQSPQKAEPLFVQENSRNYEVRL